MAAYEKCLWKDTEELVIGMPFGHHFSGPQKACLSSIHLVFHALMARGPLIDRPIIRRA